mmetsp:Transcript_15793/g.38445  ORF Transcript_15793/g.38445 Transcript_15793/m.38445 type:complete len:266 (-) Transcript_15793:1642-2439(-)
MSLDSFIWPANAWSPMAAPTPKATLACSTRPLTYSTTPTLTAPHATIALSMTSCMTATRSSARSASSARTRILSLPRSMARMTSATSASTSGPLNRFTTALVWRSALRIQLRCAATTCGGRLLGFSSINRLRAYGAAISPMSNFLLSPLPIPSSTEKARTTKVSSAGNRKGWSLDTTIRSSPMLDRICLRRSFFSSLVRCFLKSLSYSSLFSVRADSCWSTRLSKLPRKKSAVRFTAVRSDPVSTSTPILDSALTAFSEFFSYTA